MVLEYQNYNCSQMFLSPHYGIDKNSLLSHNLINTFLFYPNKDYKDCLYFLYKPADLQLFGIFAEQEKERLGELYKDDYDCVDGQSVLVYKFTSCIKNNYDRFINGEYSKMDDEFKNKIAKVIITKNERGFRNDSISLQWSIFKKDLNLKKIIEKDIGQELPPDSELWSKPNIKKETLKINCY